MNQSIGVNFSTSNKALSSSFSNVAFSFAYRCNSPWTDFSACFNASRSAFKPWRSTSFALAGPDWPPPPPRDGGTVAAVAFAILRPRLLFIAFVFKGSTKSAFSKLNATAKSRFSDSNRLIFHIAFSYLRFKPFTHTVKPTRKNISKPIKEKRMVVASNTRDSSYA